MNQRKKTKHARKEDTKRRTQDRRRARRRQVRSLLAKGKTIEEIAGELHVGEQTVYRDISALRRAAARRKPWGDPAACAAGFIEAAEAALQKVRAAQQEAEANSTLYHHLVKLEWAMLVKFIEMTGPLGKKKSEGMDNEDERYAKRTTEELLLEAKDLGIDTTGFERALRSPEAPVPDDLAGGPELDGPHDLDDAA